MGRPTLDEIYSMPEIVKDDNYDLRSITGLGPAMEFPDADLKTLRCTLTKAVWEDVPGLSKFGFGHGSNNVLKLTFNDVQGDQRYLDTHARLREDLSEIQLNIYNDTGEVVRIMTFEGLTFINGKQALNAANGKPALRVNSYGFTNRRENIPA